MSKKREMGRVWMLAAKGNSERARGERRWREKEREELATRQRVLPHHDADEEDDDPAEGDEDEDGLRGKGRGSGG